MKRPSLNVNQCYSRRKKNKNDVDSLLTLKIIQERIVRVNDYEKVVLSSCLRLKKLHLESEQGLIPEQV